MQIVDISRGLMMKQLVSHQRLGLRLGISPIRRDVPRKTVGRAPQLGWHRAD